MGPRARSSIQSTTPKRKNEYLQDAIVSDVLERLRHVGRREAELLFREHRNHPATPLPTISERISNAINAVTDAALKILDDASAGVRKSIHGLPSGLGGGHISTYLFFIIVFVLVRNRCTRRWCVCQILRTRGHQEAMDEIEQLSRFFNFFRDWSCSFVSTHCSFVTFADSECLIFV